MNSSGFETNLNHDPFVNKHESEGYHNEVHSTPEQKVHSIIYKVTSHLDEDISDYVFHRLVEVSKQLIHEKNWDRRRGLTKIADCIMDDYDKIDQQRGMIAKIINRILVQLNIRHSEQEIRVLHRTIKTPSLGSKISPSIAPRLIQEHRCPQVNVNLYDKVALVNVYFEARYKDLLTQNNQLLSTMQEPRLGIFKARLKEVAIRDVYQQELPKRIQEGYYNPAVIPLEIDRILGPKIKIPRTKFTDASLRETLKDEVDRYAKHLTDHQLNYIKCDVTETISLYLRAYPNKTHRNAFVLGRDLIRLAVYQEIFDKASFTGSDHGSKHIHHNIENAESLHKNMQPHADYSDKDRFIEHLIHFYHDIGYTVGLAGKSFSCCKDHPLIGAKMIEENREYFEHYLDQESANVLWNGVLLHAVAIPDLSPDKTKIAGMYPNMIRAVVSISDACAVTYDRKTQEFWEQPSTLIALIRLRLFLTKYPEYISKLAQSGQEEWFQLDKNNPMDVLAHDVFQNTKHILLKAVEKFDISPEKKELFRQAILQQFNSFTTSTTLGQYGGVLTGISVVENSAYNKGEPKFFPQFDMSPSIVYGTLHDLFGEDLAQASFKKLVDEFSGDLGALAKEINAVAKQASLKANVPGQAVKTGNAFFKIHSNENCHRNVKHFTMMQTTLHQVMTKIQSIYNGKLVPLSEKNKVIKELFAFRQGKSKKCHSFSDFVLEYILPNLRIDRPSEAAHDIDLITRVVKEDIFDGIKQADAIWLTILEPLRDAAFHPIQGDIDRVVAELEKLRASLGDAKSASKIAELRSSLKAAARQSTSIDESRLSLVLNKIIDKINDHAQFFKKAEQKYFAIENAVKLALVSEEEYRFMRGKKAAVSKSDCITQLVNT